jgi:uncharacterized protein (UPF0147 family)
MASGRDLTTFGARGRQLGIPILWELATDDTLPVIARIHAARALGAIRPDMRAEIIQLLRRLPTAGNEVAWMKVFDAIGQFDPAEGALGLKALASDRTLTPGIRLRAAKTMVELYREYKESAAITAREIAFDHAVPLHIRTKAARALARYSEICRSEAQMLLNEFSSGATG